MTILDEMMESVSRTMNSELDHQHQIINAMMGMVGEVSEAMEIVKKAYFQGHPFATDKIYEELGDACWYFFLFCKIMNKDPRKILQKNIEKLKARYPEGRFTIDASLNRKEQL